MWDDVVIGPDVHMDLPFGSLALRYAPVGDCYIAASSLIRRRSGATKEAYIASIICGSIEYMNGSF